MARIGLDRHRARGNTVGLRTATDGTAERAPDVGDGGPPSAGRERAPDVGDHVSARNPWRGVSDLPAPIWIVFATTLVNRAGTMVLPFMVLYVTQYLGVRPALGGAALTVYGMGGLVSGPIAGRLCDRFGPFAVLRGALAMSGLILLAFPFARQFGAFLALTFVWSLVAESVRPASLAGLTSFVRPEQRKTAVAVNRLAINLGMSIGPAVGGFLATVSFPLLFVVDGATGLAAGLLLTALLAWRPLPSSVRRPDHGGAGLHRRRADTVFRDRRAVVFLTGVFLMGTVIYQHEGAMPLFLVRDLHYRESFYGMLFVVNTVLIVVAEVPLNIAMEGWSHRWTLVLGAALYAVGFGSMAVLHSVPGLLLSAVVWTFGEMIAMPASGAYAVEVAPPGRAGQYAGAYASMFSLAVLVGPWAGTVALERLGGTVLWCGALGVGILAALVFGLTDADATRTVISQGQADGSW
jgi:predicted MFS family arabinose efflux permease